MEVIEKIKEYIAKGETEKAIQLLVEHTKDKNSPFYDEAILLSGQFRQWKRSMSLGVESSNNELRRIEMGVMNILQEKTKATVTEATDKNSAEPKKQIAATPPVDKPSGDLPQKPNMMPLILGVVGLIVAAFGFWFFTQNDSSVSVSKDDPTEIPVDDNNKKTPTPVTPKPVTPKPVTPKPVTPKPVTPKPVTPKPAKLPEVNGRNLNFVAFGDGSSKPTGYLRNLGNGKWSEEGKDMKHRFVFVEEGRDDYSVYLYDKSRKIKLRPDLHRQIVTYSDPQTPERDQYLIKSAVDKMKGTYVKKVTYNFQGKPIGIFEQVEGTKNWLEKNPDSDKRGKPNDFVEFARDEWSVYLKNKEHNDFQIQLDLYRKQVKIKESGKDAKPLYSIVKGI